MINNCLDSDVTLILRRTTSSIYVMTWALVRPSLTRVPTEADIHRFVMLQTQPMPLGLEFLNCTDAYHFTLLGRERYIAHFTPTAVL